MQITDQTTLAELAAERAVLGIIYLSINTGHCGGPTRLAIAMADGPPLYGHGFTEAEAIDDVFTQRRAQLGKPAALHSKAPP